MVFSRFAAVLALFILCSPVGVFAQANEKQLFEVSVGALSAESGSNYFPDSRVVKKEVPVALFGASFRPSGLDVGAKYYFSEGIFREGFSVYVSGNSFIRIGKFRADIGLEYNDDRQAEEILNDGFFIIDVTYRRQHGLVSIGGGLGDRSKNNFRVYYVAGADYREKRFSLTHTSGQFDGSSELLGRNNQPVQGLRASGRYTLFNRLAVDASATRTDPFVRYYENGFVGRRTLGRVRASCFVVGGLGLSVSGNWSDVREVINPEEKSVVASVFFGIR